MKNKNKKIRLTKTTVTNLNTAAQERLKGGNSNHCTISFLRCLSLGNCGAGTGVLCY